MNAVGLPGLAVIAVGAFSFLVALLFARHGAGAERAARRSSRSIVGIALQAAGFAVTAGFGAIMVSRDPLSVAALIEAALVAALMAASIGLFVWSIRTMGRNWSLVARTREDHDLVTTGPFMHVRHPIYVALFLCMVAIAIAFGHVLHLLAGIPLYAIGTWLRIVEEEHLLRAAFGTRYDDYAARVPRFMPRIG